MKKYHLKQKMAAALCAAMLLTQAAPAALAEAVLIQPGGDALSQALAEQYQASQANESAAQSEQQQNNPAPASLEPQQQDESGETQQDNGTENAEKLQKAKKIEKVEKLEKKELKIELKQEEKEQKQAEKENEKQEESGSADSQQQDGNSNADSQQQGGGTTQETAIIEQVQKPQQVVIENVQQAAPPTLQIQQLEQQIQLAPETVQKAQIETVQKLQSDAAAITPQQPAQNNAMLFAAVPVTPTTPAEDVTDAYAYGKDASTSTSKDGKISGSVTFHGTRDAVVLIFDAAGNEVKWTSIAAKEDGSEVNGNFTIADLPAGTYTAKFYLKDDIGKGLHPDPRKTATVVIRYTALDPIVMNVAESKGKITAEITSAMDRDIDVWLCEVKNDEEKKIASDVLWGKGSVELGTFKDGTYKVYADYASPWIETDADGSQVNKSKVHQAVTIAGSGNSENTEAPKPSITTITGSVTKTDNSITVSVTADTAFDRVIMVTGPNGYRQTATLTAGASAYTFTNLAPGAYEIYADYAEAYGATTYETTVTVGMAATQIAATATGGDNRVDVTITAGDDENIKVRLTGGSVDTTKTIAAGSRKTAFEGIAAGTYSVTIDYETARQGSNPVTISSIPGTNARAGISVSSIAAGEKTLTVKGTAQPGSQILVQAEPAGAQAEVLVVGEDGKFETNLSANPAVYTKVSVFYVTDVSSIVNVAGSWTVTAPTAAPTIMVDPIDNHSTTVVVKTGANMGVILTTPDSTLTAQSDASGLARFSLTHKYLKGEEFTITVVYGSASGQTVSLKVTVSGVVDYNDLEYGDYGEAVLRLTTRLNQLGYPIAPTKDYNSAVREAVRLFQIANGQEADGEAGDRMQSALYSVSAIRYGSGRYPTLVRGDSGLALIKTLQQRLKDLGYYTIKVDGIFGSGTQRAVRLFQQINGLPDTGIADNATQVLLYSSAAKPLGYVPSDGYSTLQRSSKYKSAVVPLQRRLRELGYYSGSIDGYFGSKTYRAVRNFQSRNGLSVTGVADAYTQQLLYSSAAKKYNGSSAGSSSSTSTGYRLLYWGCRGAEVTRLQNALINAGYKKYVRSADGIYGQWTYDAVCAYQRDHGLTVDGIAGKKTQNKLYGTNY